MSDGINPHISRKKRAYRPIADYLEGLQKGDRFALSEVLTIIENNNPATQLLRDELLGSITAADSAGSLRIGMTGSPGAGKSTLIEQLGQHYLSQGKKVAVLAIDPSSIRTEGSILGDKTRMPMLSNHENAFVRPTASATHLGGVSKTTQESIAICEKAGYNVIIIESVGVGQSEVELAALVDIYGVVLLPGGGDDVQGIKRGIIEMADFLVINKADGDRAALAKQSQRDFAGSVALFPHDLPEWKTPVLTASALLAEGITDIATTISDFITIGKKGSYFINRRKAQEANYLRQQVKLLVTNKVESLLQQIKNSAPSALPDTDDRSIFALSQEIISKIASKLEE